ncbi:MAG TPA: hypothetical protein VFE61_15090 [Candidatus Sulfotelmatobacter sp.]|nr:hypothetical protein [Candidatus Sulfotelmatobacter sp.]
MELRLSSRIAISGIFLIGIWIGSENPALAQGAKPTADSLEAQTPESQITSKKGQQLSIPSETLLEFRIAQPVSLPVAK